MRTCLAGLLLVLMAACSPDASDTDAADRPTTPGEGRASDATASSAASSTPSATSESPGPGDHPINLYDGGGAPILVTVQRLDRAGTATVWRRETGGWQRLGTLERAVPPDGRYFPYYTYLAPGPGSRDIVANQLARRGVGFSHDGGATWTYLALPPNCAAGGGGCSAVVPTTDHLYVDSRDTAMRAAFGASRWTQIVLPHPGSGVTPLEDALLSTDLDCDNTVNHYWVSRDDGDSWSVRRAFPEGTCLVRPAGNVVFTAGAEETRWWRSKDLVHWDRASTTRYDDEVSRRAYSACPSSLGREPGHRGGDEHPVRIGAEVFKLFHLSNTDSRKLELRVSHDDCRTWKRVLP